MQPMRVAVLAMGAPTFIQKIIGDSTGERETGFIFYPCSGDIDCQDEQTCDLLLLEPGLKNWEWLKLLLQNRQQHQPLPVILFSPQIEVPPGVLALEEDPSILLFNDPDRLKGHLDYLLAGRQRSGKTLLFVDDDQNILKSYERGMRKSPWRILTTSSGEKAIEMVNCGQVDLIVTDIKMPGMHGFTLISKIRQENHTIPIIVCSAYPGLRQDADLYLGKVAAFMEKPVSMEALETRVRDLLG
jgi:CheY-like chemotaxis protein